MWTVLAPVASAQAPVIDRFSAQTYRPPIDARTSLWTERTTILPDWTTTAQVVGMYTRRPLVYQVAGEEQVLLGDVFQTDVVGAMHLGPFRFGLTLPLYLSADGSSVERGAGLGDLGLDAKVGLLADGRAPFGLAVAGRLLLSTGTVTAPLVNDGTGWELTALADKQVGRLVLAANAGLRRGPAVELENVSLGDAFVYRGATSFLLAEHGGISVDVAGHVNLADRDPSGSPTEFLVGGFGRIGSSWWVRAGAGAGITSGIGAPDGRVVLGLGYEIPIPGPELHIGPVDGDGDGIAYRDDACPREAEDLDGVADHDGCPDRATKIQLAAETPDGRPLSSANLVIKAGDWSQAGVGSVVATVEPGTYVVAASAPGYEPAAEVALLVSEGPQFVWTQVLEPGGVPVSLALTDYYGRSVPGGEWSTDGVTWRPIDSAYDMLPIGLQTLYLRAPGHLPGVTEVEIAPDRPNVLRIAIGRRARLVKGQIELAERVNFPTSGAQVGRTSYELLDEVAAIATGHREITRLKVAGHTDSEGEARANAMLSERRAGAVAAYLRSKGVAAARIVIKGYGEESPVATNDTEEGRAQNRRVEITVETPDGS